MDSKIVHSNVTVGENGHLLFAGTDTVSIAEKYGTPVFLLDDTRVRMRIREYKEAMARNFGEGSVPLFASKSLSFKEIYRIMAEEGIGTDIVSSGELFTAVCAGFPMERAFFHGNNKTDFDIEYAIERRIGYFIVDSMEELSMIELWYGTRYQVNLGDTNQIDYKIASMNYTIANLSEYETGVLDVSFTTWEDKVGYTPFE